MKFKIKIPQKFKTYKRIIFESKWVTVVILKYKLIDMKLF